MKFISDDIRLADMADIPAWMGLVKMAADGYLSRTFGKPGIW